MRWKTGLAIILAGWACLHLAQPASGWAPVPGSVQQEFVDDTTYNHPCYAERLENGNFLFCRVGYKDPAVVEVDREGNQRWIYPGVQPAFATRLANGNTLVADTGTPGLPSGPRVVEVNAAGRIVWEYGLGSPARSPRYVQRLSNGNTLVTLPFKIIEVTPAKKVVWSYGSERPLAPGQPGFLANPVQAARLPGGNTLIVDRGFGQGRVLEVSPAGEVVWQFGDPPPGEAWPLGPPGKNEGGGPVLAGPTSALRLEDGSTLITDPGAKKVFRVSAGGELLQEKSWAPVIEPWPVWNIWHAAADEKGQLLLTTTLSSSKSRVLLLAINP